MKYMGSKRRLRKELLPIILKGRTNEQWYVEPFVGGANMIEFVNGKRLGSDNNRYLIALLEAIRDGIKIERIDESKYNDIRANKDSHPDYIVGFAGFCCSYSGKFFGGWSRDKLGKRDYVDEALRNISKMSLSGILFHCGDYRSLDFPPNSIIYCDPPYYGTTKYKDNFDHEIFWSWCNERVDEGHSVFVSEYTAPIDWDCVFEKKQVSSLTKQTGSKVGYERLFTKQAILATAEEKQS